MQSPRLSIKAIILKDNQVLAIKKLGKHGVYHLLPGGGQEKGETVLEALQRECREEIGTEVVVKKMQFVRDYINANHTFDDDPDDFHQVELMFTCRLAKEQLPKTGTNPDNNQIDVVWLNVEELDKVAFYPSSLKEHLLNETSLKAVNPIYLGDVN